MKSLHFARIFAILTVCAGTTFAATKPLNTPQGLAVDAKGNLYVANSGGNQILIYNPNYVQQTGKTISKNVSSPAGVAIDVLGNIWVANIGGGINGTGSITAYSSTGVQGPNRTIAQSVDYPYAIATDALGDVWVQNNFNLVNVYPAYGTNPPNPIKSFPFSNAVTGLAAHNMWMALGNNTNTTLYEISAYLTGTYTVGGTISSDAYSLAWDSAGDLYCGTIQQTLNVSTAATNVTTVLVNLGYFPWGVAVDSARNRVYVSNANGNQINVYDSKTGALLHTIQ